MPDRFTEDTGVVLTFTTNNPSETSILSCDGTTLYLISTMQSDESKSIDTTIRRADGEVMAVLHWRGLLPDKLEGAVEDVQTPQIKYCKFLRSIKPSTFQMYDKTFEWIRRGSTEEPVLLDLERNQPIVVFVGPKRDITTFQFDPPHLWCEFSVIDMIDTIVITFLVLWKNQRTKASLGI